MTGVVGQQNQQERLYFLLNQLQKMSKEVPGNLQQRLPYELLSELAASLAQVVLIYGEV
jgi:DiGeorge syndrome critical region 6 (DGCR6) protein